MGSRRERTSDPSAVSSKCGVLFLIADASAAPLDAASPVLEPKTAPRPVVDGHCSPGHRHRAHMTLRGVAAASPQSTSWRPGICQALGRVQRSRQGRSWISAGQSRWKWTLTRPEPECSPCWRSTPTPDLCPFVSRAGWQGQTESYHSSRVSASPSFWHFVFLEPATRSGSEHFPCTHTLSLPWRYRDEKVGDNLPIDEWSSFRHQVSAMSRASQGDQRPSAAPRACATRST